MAIHLSFPELLSEVKATLARWYAIALVPPSAVFLKTRDIEMNAFVGAY